MERIMQEKAPRYILSPYIYLAIFSDEGMGILLDMQHEYYEKITSCVDWLMFFQKPHSLEDLHQHHADIQSDLLSPFVEHCIEHKYICEASSELSSLPTSPSVPIGRKRLFLLQLLHLFPFSLAYHIESYLLIDSIDRILEAHTCYALVQYIAQLTPSQSTPERLLQKLCQGIRASAIVHKSEALCLHQSLALFWMLRSRGYHADVQIRIQIDPFLAHMIVLEGKERVLWWQTGSVPQQYYKQFLSSTTPIFSSNRLQTQIFFGGGET
jgi:hypothetical protein